MTTLIDVLEQAAEHADAFANMIGLQFVHGRQFAAFAASVRQRAVWVRELEADAAKTRREDAFALGWRGALERLTGPIPSETAPAAPKEGTVKR